jgi:two-component system, NarL family, sensor histidine kinase DegS
VTLMPDSPSKTGGSSRIASMVDDLRKKRADLEEQRKELAVLIKQTASEIDRVAQRARDSLAQLRQVESNMEGYSHAEIRRAYAGAQEAQMRQFMMQSQLEQQRNRQNSLDSAEELLRQLLETAEEITAATERQHEDATPSVSAAEQAAQSRTSAQTLFRSVELAQTRISRHLQEETGQTISDLILRAEVCERLVDMDRQKAKMEVTRLKQTASAALKSTRQLAQELRAPALDEASLATALRRYVETSRSSEKFQVDLNTVGLEKPLPQATKVAVFRIVQEALSNAAKHSGAAKAEVRVRHEEGQLLVTVSDEGSGFDVDAVLQQARTRDQSGLTDMQLRAEIVNGTLDLISKPGLGCTVSLSIPA